MGSALERVAETLGHPDDVVRGAYGQVARMLGDLPLVEVGQAVPLYFVWCVTAAVRATVETEADFRMAVDALADALRASDPNAGRETPSRG